MLHRLLCIEDHHLRYASFAGGSVRTSDPAVPEEEDLEDHSSGVSYLSAIGILQICKVSILPVLDHFGIALAVQTSTCGMV